MFFLPRYFRHPAFVTGARDMVPQSPGIAAWGLMTGVAMVKSGMSVFEATLMTALVFAGSAQLAAIPLIVAGAPLGVILATAFCVNLRFVVFSLHLRPHLMHLPRLQRLGHAYFIADITYALFTRRYREPALAPTERLAREAYLAGNCCINWSSWTLSSLLGIALAHVIPTQWGLGFAGTLCLIGVMCSLASSRLRLVAAAAAGAAAVMAWALPLKLNIVIAIVAAVLLCLGLEKVRGMPRGGSA